MIKRTNAIQQAMTLRGMLDESQLYFLYDLAEKAVDGTAVECGVLYGRSLAAWAPKRKGRGEIVAVDCWQRGDKQHQAFLFNMTQLQMQCRTISGNSWEVADQVGPTAFCFIDACHGPEGIGRDVPVWTAKIVAGGIIAFHDYGTWKCPAVKEAVDRWQKVARWEEMGLVGATMAYRRPER